MSDIMLVPKYDELYHYGVKGMKWGHRKKYITTAEGMRKARSASQDAWRKTTTEQGGKLVGKNKSIAVYPNAKTAYKAKRAAKKNAIEAGNKSIKESKAYNKRLKAEMKAERKEYKELTALSGKQKVIRNGATFVALMLSPAGLPATIGVTAATAYGTTSYMRAKNDVESQTKGKAKVSEILRAL